MTVSNSTPIGIDQRPRTRRAHDRHGLPFDETVTTRNWGPPQVASTDATCGSRATRARAASTSTRSSGVPGSMPAVSRTWSGGEGRDAVDLDGAHGEHRAGRGRPADGDEREHRERAGRAAGERRRGGPRGDGADQRGDRRRPDGVRAGRRDRPVRSRVVGPGADSPVPGLGAASAATFRARSASSTSGPTIETSPAPMVSTRSPGRARAAERGAAADHDGSKTKCAGGSGTAAATSAPVTPGHRVLAGAVDLHDHDLVGEARAPRRSPRRTPASGCTGAAGTPRRADRCPRRRAPPCSCAATSVGWWA